MEVNFWLDVWDKRQLGFNQSEFNPKMVELLKDKSLSGQTVFVPLCGKSIDMIWFLNKGANVYACELSAVAIEEFFQENNIEYQIQEYNDYKRFIGDNITIDCGDFFNLDIPRVDFIYDRASMVALPTQMRARYQQKMKNLFKGLKEYYLFTFSYDQSLFDGPPFSIDEPEVLNVFNEYEINKVFSETKNSDFKGVDLNVTRSVYLIK